MQQGFKLAANTPSGKNNVGLEAFGIATKNEETILPAIPEVTKETSQHANKGNFFNKIVLGQLNLPQKPLYPIQTDFSRRKMSTALEEKITSLEKSFISQTIKQSF